MIIKDLDRTLFDLFVKQIKANLREKIIEAIEPDIDAAIFKFMNEFKLQIEQVYDCAQQRVIVNLAVNKKERSPLD